AARRGADVIRLQSVYSALAMGGGIAVMTIISGFLFEHYQGGVVGKGVTGPAVSFALKAANAAGGDCANLTAQDTAQVRWFSPKMDALGLGMTSGEANDSRVLLTAVNTKSANPVSINNSNDTAEFEANKVVNDGLKFEAKLQGGQTPGRFQSVAKVDILYK
ncbi:hypothetical protein B4907_20895, partial [Yersinia kristensenii]